ncbi:ABC transporter substrate-binding protein [Ferrimonas sp. YFM]|uniref:MlaC/ttg2D family ABC transporter substrate-binding protein n=1 Tax=Ferrimonas sp. YFM TaxID=3028878 RepID=UPI002572D208|nr:ABC transporter substrate-binding protein [Ferrimonas sp. YFM]BDY06705.1 organic solvent ABC transporter substrate-binding protein [Ferrimonas sp. YFM]
MIKRILQLGLVLLVAAVMPAKATSYTNPYVMMQEVADKAFSRLAQERGELEQDPAKVRALIDEELLPYIDYKYAAYKVMGQQARRATKEQRLAFTEQFKEYMLATFANAFNKYNDQTLQFAPEQPYGDAKIVAINVKLIEERREPVDLQFKARKNKKGHWKVFDLVAEGISLLASQQAELGGLIRQNGIESVTAQLAERNRQGIVATTGQSQ